MPVAALVLAALAAATQPPPAPTRWVEDHAQLMSAGARDVLDVRLESYQRATGHQVVVWIGTTLEGQPLDDWAVRTFAAWKIGRKGLDDGIAMFIFAQDRTIDIEVGYGLEDKITDALASRIIREVMAPKLKADDRDGAVTSGVDALLTGIEGKPWGGSAAPATSQPDQPHSLTTGEMIFGGLALIGLVILFITHPRMAMFLLWTFMSGGRGGGFGGGGGGGFGGGGGRSGGGGARGGW